MKSYAFVIGMTLAFSSSCVHNSPSPQDAAGNAAQELSSPLDCQPNSDIERNPQKQKSFASVRSHCQTEINNLCHEITCRDLMKPTQVCLMMNEAELSMACKKDLNRHIKEYQPYVKSLKE